MFKKIILFFALCTLPLQASLAQDELKGVTLRIVTDPTFPPFSYLKDDYISPQGIEVDVILELQKRLGFSLAENRIFPLTHKEKLNSLQQGKIDFAGGGISVTPERAKLMHFSPIYYKAGISILYSTKHSKEPINSFKDLANKKVVVVNGTIAQSLLEEQDEVKITAREVHNFNDGLFAVSYGDADAFVFDRDILVYYADKLHCLNLAVGHTVYAEELSQFAFATPLDSPYSKYLDREIKKILEDGTFDKILAKHIKQ